MAKATRFMLGLSLLSDRVHVGRAKHMSGGVWAFSGQKHDVTVSFLATLLQWLPPGTERTVTDAETGDEYVLTCVKKRTRRAKRKGGG